ncbi:hypothetical protein BpHYR1_018045 [Brachionus plicatilis]|uniref:Uncharacterized protein n=1 Tax=Brachionus plicatilis TaxID=10195 RepID=A0A3M7RQT0_BRAPC|nr:hypothetical protein BpHYR1_018045 [Brachionus plicatilis]
MIRVKLQKKQSHINVLSQNMNGQHPDKNCKCFEPQVFSLIKNMEKLATKKDKPKLRAVPIRKLFKLLKEDSFKISLGFFGNGLLITVIEFCDELVKYLNKEFVIKLRLRGAT